MSRLDLDADLYLSKRERYWYSSIQPVPNTSGTAQIQVVQLKNCPIGTCTSGLEQVDEKDQFLEACFNRPVPTPFGTAQTGEKTPSDSRPSAPSVLPSCLLLTRPIEVDVVDVRLIMRHSFHPPDNGQFTEARKTGYFKRGRNQGKSRFSSRFVLIFGHIRPFQGKTGAGNASFVPHVLEAI